MSAKLDVLNQSCKIEKNVGRERVQKCALPQLFRHFFPYFLFYVLSRNKDHVGLLTSRLGILRNRTHGRPGWYSRDYDNEWNERLRACKTAVLHVNALHRLYLRFLLSFVQFRANATKWKNVCLARARPLRDRRAGSFLLRAWNPMKRK